MARATIVEGQSVTAGRVLGESVAGLDARVVANEPICREHIALELALPQFPDSEPGQFLELQCAAETSSAARELEWPLDGFPSLKSDEWRTTPVYLRRPFSIADRWTDPHGRVRLLVISRRVGPGTQWLEQLRPDDVLSVTGPLGRGFLIPPRGVPIVLVGGGVGIPPLLYLSRRLHELGHTDVAVVLGAKTRDLLPVRLLAEPAADGTPRPCVALPGDARYAALITSDDGSVGLRGLVTDGLAAWHARADASRRGLVLACGPEGMLRGVAELTRRLHLDCQLCIERHMGCGLGTCLSCVVRVCDPERPGGWRWALACTDGPVFWRDELFDYSPAARA